MKKEKKKLKLKLKMKNKIIFYTNFQYINIINFMY